jgi:23S rRNA pseudouridine1911/1915/1917 synthase
LGNPRGASDRLLTTLHGFRRQALHAASLGFDHPRSGARMSLESPLPGDYAELLTALREDAA